MWNKDEVQGKTDQVKGKIKESVGNATNDEQLRDEGTADKAANEMGSPGHSGASPSRVSPSGDGSFRLAESER